MPRKGEEEGWPAKGAKRKKGRVKTGQETVDLRSQKEGILGKKGGADRAKKKKKRVCNKGGATLQCHKAQPAPNPPEFAQPRLSRAT